MNIIIHSNFIKIFGFIITMGLGTQASTFESSSQQNNFENLILKNLNSMQKEKKSSFSQLDSIDQKVTQFYQFYNFQNVWIQDKKLSIAGQAALQTLKNSYKEGIESLSQSEIQDIETALSNFEKSDEEVALYDIRLTKSVLAYIDDLYGKRSDLLNLTENEFKSEKEKLSHAETAYKKFFHIPNHQDLSSVNTIQKSEDKKNIVSKINSVNILAEGLQKDPTGQWLIDLTIPHLGYQKLKKILEIWHEFINHNIKLQKIIYSKDFNLISSSPLVLDENQLKDQFCYLTNISLQDSSLLSQTALIRKFQEKYKISVTGILDSSTLTTLFNEVLLKYQQILITMEQWRHLPLDLGTKYILVNIPNFTLSAFDIDRKILEMPVIIGTSYRPTPVIETKIDRITFNPMWYVPQSIAVKDKLPLLRKNPASFNQKKYEIFNSNGQLIDPLTVNWSNVQPQNFNYKIVQQAGPDNALGKLFFHINTPYGIYLHGTSQPELFNQIQRSLSSGCIRLKDPEALAKFVLANVINEPSDYIQAHLADKKTFTILINPTLSVYIIYHTVWVDDQDQVHFEKDIYNRGKFLQQILPLSFPPAFFSEID